jgi:hypothetical protein
MTPGTSVPVHSRRAINELAAQFVYPTKGNSARPPLKLGPKTFGDDV